MSLPKVSIITPIFNSEKYLTKFLDNLLLQDYQDLEVVIIDNESTDRSVEIIKQFSTVLNIIFKSEKDTGIYDAMNKGVGLASGEYLLFLGADDQINDNKTLKSVFENADYLSWDLIYGKFRFSGTEKVRGGPRDKKSILLNNICHQAIFYHRSVFSIVGNYNLDFPICADFDFNIRCFLEPRIRTKFLNTVIGCFQSGGASFAGCDAQFLLKQKRLIIDKMGYLAYYFNTIKQKLLLIAKKSGVIT